MHRPEILAPAGSPEALLAAVRCGADAVYLGGKAYSARSGAENFGLPGLEAASRLCRLYGVKLYLTVNTLLTDTELPAFAAFMQQAAPLVDACIVQDLGVLRLLRDMLPDMPLHASTQMSVYTPEGVRQAASLGCRRVVAARELDARQLAELCRLPVEIEVFVHGALCMSVSGQCSFSALVGGRSANRGQCAQACRLDWRTPEGRHPAALSLRDNCLIPHAAALQEMGVASFKIEGRMKRPEYVAAAVTALRAARDGMPPDLDTLRAVFSRNGFTDGYFTGEKRNMFGYRRREDVLAGQQVLGTLAELYRKPRTVTGLTFSMRLHAGEAAVLHVHDREGHAVTVRGAVPEPARTAPLDAERLGRSLQKLGETVYAFDGASLENPDGLLLTAAQCNAMRRDAVAEMDALRIAAHTPERRVLPCPVLPEGKLTPDTPRLRLHVRDARQLAAAIQTGEIVCVPAGMECAPGMSVWVEAPRIIEDEQAYRAQLARLREQGFSHLLCHNLADISLGNALGFTLHGGFGLNVANRMAAQTLRELGLRDVTASVELRTPRIRDLSAVLPTGMIVYGRLPMMLLRVCPIRMQDGCRGKDCFLTDRTGRRFPLLCHGTYQELLNADILWLADGLPVTEYRDLYFAEESPRRMAEVLHAFREGGEAPPHRTRGLYEKGGLI